MQGFSCENFCIFSLKIFACSNFLPLLCKRFRHTNKCLQASVLWIFGDRFSVFFELNFFSKKNVKKKLRKILVIQKFALPLHSLSGRNDSDAETQTILDNIPYRQSSTTCLCCLAINNKV